MLADILQKRIHEELKWSLRTVAKETGLHYEMVRKLVSGETRDPHMSTLFKLMNGLNLSPTQIFAESCDRTNPDQTE